MIVRSDRGRDYASPYLAGVGLGLVLLAAYLITGRGLGASGAFSSVVAHCAAWFDAARAGSNPAFAPWLATAPWREWLVLEVAGLVLGAWVSARTAGRTGWRLDRGPQVSARRRLLIAFAGGILMGIGARLARGCTSGQALTGGALLSVGSWIFVFAAFAAGYLAAPLFRRQWR